MRLILLTFGWLALLATTSAQVFTLDSVLAEVERRNLMLQEYDDKVKAIESYASGANSWMAPMVGAGTFMTPYPNQMLMDERDKGAVMFSVEQEIPNPLKQNANRRYLASRTGVEKANRSIILNTLRAEAKMNYYSLLVAYRKLGVLEESTRIIDLMLKLAKVRYPYNQGALGNVYKAEGRLAEVENMRWMVLADIEDRNARLNALMNREGGSVDSLMIDTTLVVEFDIDRVVEDTAALASRRSDIRQIDQTIETMRLNQQLQKSMAKPDFRLKFDHMQPLGDMPTQFSAMAMISIPIAPWSSRMYKAEVRGMEWDIAGMQKGRQGLLIETRGMIAGMSRQIERMQQQIDNYQRRIVPALEKNFSAVMLAYEENKGELPAVVDAWEAMNMAQLELLDKTNEYYKMIVEYEKQVEQ